MSVSLFLSIILFIILALLHQYLTRFEFYDYFGAGFMVGLCIFEIGYVVVYCIFTEFVNENEWFILPFIFGGSIICGFISYIHHKFF